MARAKIGAFCSERAPDYGRPRPKVPPPPLRVAVDTGGTFTDCVWMERGKLRMTKVFSTPADPSEAIMAALVANRYLPAESFSCTARPSEPIRCCSAKGARGLRHHGWFRGHHRDRTPESSAALRSDLSSACRRWSTAACASASQSASRRTARFCRSLRAEDLRVLARDVHASGAERLPSRHCFPSPIRKTSARSVACSMS